jgi:hypothetical protein
MKLPTTLARRIKRATVLTGVSFVLAAKAWSQADGAADSSTSAPPAITATNASALASIARTNVAVPAKASMSAAPASLASPAGSSSSAALTGNDYPSFKIVIDRNIFDPNRRKGGVPSKPKDGGAPKPVEETFSLTGILSSGKGTFAFFDGSSSSFRAAFQTKASIGGCKISKISPPDQVELEVAGKKVELGIGMMMRRQDGGPWKLGGMSDSSSGSSWSSREKTSVFGDSSPRTRAFGAPSADAGDSDSPAAAPGGMSEALKRLMQKREQELKNGNP